MQELKLNYPTTKGKVYSEEEDRYLRNPPFFETAHPPLPLVAELDHPCLTISLQTL